MYYKLPLEVRINSSNAELLVKYKLTDLVTSIDMSTVVNLALPKLYFNLLFFIQILSDKQKNSVPLLDRLWLFWKETVLMKI